MIELEFNIPLSPEETWDRLTQKRHVAEWWGPDVKLEAFKKGKFFEAWTDSEGRKQVASGEVTAFEPPVRLQLNFQQQDWPSPTRVEFLLQKYEGGTRLYLQHSGWDIIENEQTRRKEVDAHLKGWTEILEKFVRLCRTT